MTVRKRNVQIMFRLNEQEADQLNDLVRRSGLKRERFLRSMILGYRLCEKPDTAFYDIQKELCTIGNRAAEHHADNENYHLHISFTFPFCVGVLGGTPLNDRIWHSKFSAW